MNLFHKASVHRAALLLTLFLAVSCQFYQEKDPNGGDLKRTSFRMVMQNVLSTRCLRCHSDEFSSYEAIRSRISEIQDRALVRKDMPPGSPLTQFESRVLQNWIDAGMPLNEDETSSQPVPAPPPLAPTFQSIRTQIFESRCIKCHGPGGSHDDIDIFDQTLLTGRDGWVVPFDPDKSELYQDLIKTGKGRMPPLAKPGNPPVPPLTAEQIQTVRTWILNGAKD